MKNKEKEGEKRYPPESSHFNNPVECLFLIFDNTHDFSNIYVKKSSGKRSNLNVKTRSRKQFFEDFLVLVLALPVTSSYSPSTSLSLFIKKKKKRGELFW